MAARRSEADLPLADAPHGARWPGPKPIARGALYLMLQNRIYRRS